MRRKLVGSDQPQRLRCAVYMRKSSEVGLEQNFNSLQTPRPLC